MPCRKLVEALRNDKLCPARGEGAPWDNAPGGAMSGADYGVELRKTGMPVGSHGGPNDALRHAQLPCTPNGPYVSNIVEHFGKIPQEARKVGPAGSGGFRTNGALP